MRFSSYRWIHGFCALAFAWSFLFPAMVHGNSTVSSSTVLTMQLCVADGSKQTIDLEIEQTKSTMFVDCPNCVAQSLAPVKVLADLQFAPPSTFIPTPKLFLESAKPLFAWVKLPSQGPPSQDYT